MTLRHEGTRWSLVYGSYEGIEQFAVHSVEPAPGRSRDPGDGHEPLLRPAGEVGRCFASTGGAPDWQNPPPGP